MSGEIPRTIGEMSYNTRLIVARFAETKTGEIITYEELSQVIGKNIHNGGIGMVYSALRIVRRDYGFVFETIRKVGFKQASDEEILNSSISILPARMKSLARRESKKIACVNNENMTNEMRVKRDMSLALIGITELFTGTKNLKILEGKITETAKLPPLKDIMFSLCAG